MTERAVAERIIHDLHAARVRGDLEAMCRLFAEDGRYRIAGASSGNPVSIDVQGVAAFKPWLSMLVKAFRVSHYEMATLVIDGSRVAVHWRADIHSKVTGVTVTTELIDLLEIRSQRVHSYTEFFVGR